MPLETQGKIVRALQDSTFERLGGSARIKVDVRVLSTTNKDLQTEIASGRFREDLYYRLAVVPLKVPALKDRREDVPALAQRFIVRSAESAGMQPRELSADTLAALQAYDWPGNVRQLRNLMDWLLIMAPGGGADVIRADMLPPEIGANAPALLNIDPTADIMGLPLREARDLFETQYLQAQLLRFGGNISRTAQFVGMERSALHRKLKQLGRQFRREGRRVDWRRAAAASRWVSKGTVRGRWHAARCPRRRRRRLRSRRRRCPPFAAARSVATNRGRRPCRRRGLPRARRAGACYRPGRARCRPRCRFAGPPWGRR
jgi:sigma54-dependent transcription regulator